MRDKKTYKSSVFIINSCGPNRGDSAVLQSMIDALKEIEDIKIVVSAIYPEYVPHIEGVEVVPPTPNIDISPWMPFRVARNSLVALLSKLSIKCLQFLPQEEREILAKYYEADIVLSAGGHHLTDMNGLASFFRQWYQLFLAILIGKPTVIYAQTIGPFNHFSRLLKFLTRLVLNRTKLITVREKNSKDIVTNDLRVRHPPIYVTADAVFSLNPAEPLRVNEILVSEGIVKGEGRPLVGITVYHAKYYGYSDPEKRFAEYKETMAEIADYLVGSLDATVIFIPMEMQYAADIPLIIDVVDRMQYRNRAKVFRNKYTAKETMGIIQELDLFIGAKTHSIVFALAGCVPTICLAYHRKAMEFMEMFGVAKYAYDIATISSQNLISAVDDAWYSRAEIRKELELKMKDIKERALLNAELVKELIEGKRNAR
jgi:colanic acid/amylovoran biosynthesis protein